MCERENVSDFTVASPSFFNGVAMTTVYQSGTNRESIPLSERVCLNECTSVSLSNRKYQIPHKEVGDITNVLYHDILETDGYGIHHSSDILSCKCHLKVMKELRYQHHLQNLHSESHWLLEKPDISISTSSTTY